MRNDLHQRTRNTPVQNYLNAENRANTAPEAPYRALNTFVMSERFEFMSPVALLIDSVACRGHDSRLLILISKYAGVAI